MSTSERAERPWGAYTVLQSADGYQVKAIVVKPGRRLSYQRHTKRAEHWFIVRGAGEVVLDGTSRAIGAGDSVDVAIGGLHRISNTGDEPLVFIEVQTGTYFGEDDIERLEDDFGRS